MITLNSIHRYRLFVLLVLLNAVFLSSLLGRRKKPSPPPSLVRDVDIKIWDEDHLRGYNGKPSSSRGEGKNFKPKSTWTITTDFWSHRGSIEDDVLNGKYGTVSGKVVYTTYRSIKPLSDEEYAEGNKSVLDNNVSNLVTPAFDVKLDYVTFLISGGYFPGKACINLLVDDKIVRTATGRNSDYLEWVAFDVREFKGKEARIQVVDTTSSCFGYITVDCVCLSPDKKNAVRVIDKTPVIKKIGSVVETLDTKLTGVPSLKDSKFAIDGKNISLNELLKFTSYVKIGDSQSRRIELINGDRIICEVSLFENNKLQFKHSIIGEKSLQTDSIAQVKFAPGPSVDLKRRTMLHENGNKIPGEITFIRDNKLSLKCALGQLPLPLARVNAFVFNQKKPSENKDKITLRDGSILSGTLKVEGEAFSLDHESLGNIKFKLTDVAKIVLLKSNLTPLSNYKFSVSELTGPLTPPEPEFLENSSQQLLRIHSKTKVNFQLAETNSSKRFKSVLKPVANCSTNMTVLLRSGSQEKKLTIEPNSEGIAVDFDLKSGQQLEMVINAENNVSYPSGVEWHGAIIIEDKK